MKKRHIIGGVLVAGIIAIGAIYYAQPSRLPEEHLEASQQVVERLEAIDQSAAAEPAPGEEPLGALASEEEQQESGQADDETAEEEEEVTAPDVFQVKFETSVGDIIVEAYRDWAPIGVDRFYELVKEEFFDEARFFRVVPGFVVQFGLAADPEVTAEWREKNLEDEPVRESNEAGTLTFAKTQMPNSRTTQLFINLADNPRLDEMGFSPFARVIEGMDAVREITAEYGERPQQPIIQAYGNEYLEAEFPNLDYIEKARIYDPDAEEEEAEEDGGDS